MQQYFTANQPHLEDHVDLAYIINNEPSNSKSIISLGMDSIIYLKNLQSNEQKRIYLSQSNNYNCISKAHIPQNCFLGNQNGVIQLFNLNTQQSKQIYKSQYKFNSLSISNSNRYLAASSQESKTILINLQDYKYNKLRPGHQSGVANSFFSHDQKYLASIGMDKMLLIYKIESFDKTIQMFRLRICKGNQINPMTLSASFHKYLPILYSSGLKQLQIIQYLNSKWQHRLSTNIKHSTNLIHLVKTIKDAIIITSCQQKICIWNNRNQQKLVQVQNFSLNKIIQVNSTFFGVKNDGRIYQYKRIIKQQSNNAINNRNDNVMQMQIQHSNNLQDKNLITFDNDLDQQNNEGNQKQEIQDNISEQQLKFQIKKKSKAQQIIKVFPQQKIINSTSLFDGSRFLLTSQYGYIIEKEIKIADQFEHQIQFQSEDQTKNQILFTNKKIQTVDLNPLFLTYANQTFFGIKFLRKISQFNSWQKNWWDITMVTSTINWIAVANQNQIKIFDLAGNQIKNISFDRQLVAITAYQNLLTVVYHQSIPMWHNQNLAMNLYVIDNKKNQGLKCSSCHVPLKSKSMLKFFRFSDQGMLISQDTYGFIRIYNLQYNSWTPVFIEGIQDIRRIWLLGMTNYQMIYWRTSQINPDPQVFPRLPVKNSRLGLLFLNDFSQQLNLYPFLMFERFKLDHQKCRTRLWSHLKHIQERKKQLGSKILTQKELMKHHNQLDYKFFHIIKYYLKQADYQRVLTSCKSLLRTIEAGKNMVELIDDLKLRYLAVDLQKYFDGKQKQLQYQAIQQMKLENLKLQAQKTIKPKTQNHFMKKKNTNFMIPSLNSSQTSQLSNFDSLSEKSINKKQNGMTIANKISFHDTPQKQQVSNPFLKKRSNDQSQMNFKSKQIEQQIQKFGIKKKAQVKKIPGRANF